MAQGMTASQSGAKHKISALPLYNIRDLLAANTFEFFRCHIRPSQNTLPLDEIGRAGHRRGITAIFATAFEQQGYVEHNQGQAPALGIG